MLRLGEETVGSMHASCDGEVRYDEVFVSLVSLHYQFVGSRIKRRSLSLNKWVRVDSFINVWFPLKPR